MEEIAVKWDVDDINHEGRDDEMASAGSPSFSDSDSDEETAEELEIGALEKQLEENPLNYEAHVQYIQHLRKHGHVEKLQQARESMNRYFPLSPKMWQDWAKDEATLNPESENFEEIEKIYERGVHEYLFVPLWCDYLEFVEEHDPLVSECAPAGLSKMRTLFEHALTAAGLHFSEGGNIWEAYREFEQAVFLTIDGSDNEEKVKQAQRIRSLFYRQLSVPLINLRSTLTDYKLWEAEQGNLNDVNSEFDGVSSNIISAYQKALEMGSARAPYEEQLSNCDATEVDKLQHYMNYIKLEDSVGDPARVQALYERALTDFPVSSDLWLGYTSYLDRTFKVSEFVKDVYSRATRNCTWVGELWINHMLALERMSASEKELSTVFERAIQYSFPSVKEYLELFLTRIDGLRRRISSTVAKEDGLDYSLIRETFQRAVDYFSLQVISNDDLLHLYAYWAHLEATLGKDFVAARGVWESLIKKSGSLLEAWQGYIAMEVRMGHINEARSIYKRCYSKRLQGTGSEDICHSWLRFEREYGTLDDLDLAVKKVTPRLQELTAYKTQQDSKGSLSTQKNVSVAAVASQKRKANKTFGDKQTPAKKKKDVAQERSEASLAVPTSTSVPNQQDETLRGTGEHQHNVKDVRDSKLNKTKLFYTDNCTAFVSNLSLEVTEKHLHGFFMDSGGVAAIRLLRDKFNGRSRGLAYVDFVDEEHLAAAIAKNKHKLLGKRLSIARSDPKQGRNKSSTSSHSRARGGDLKKDHKGVAEGSGAPPREDSRNTAKPSRNITFAAPRAGAMTLGWPKRGGVTD
ncbi:squamous cell carcinoma antigen recognized by T-cells 3 isoform X2 [Phalaenopsis equestris]|uniref:squamous cell carcinoma antigen recognized by T-cells 3 isoform X2 n=1 Tax=Phalaenopsis equestris TaxID=78828 RepID=UPI0009E40112|nr:squamous cell carcinoma antigen recognized by T-cells 3 isoform X2 [Phalaenopsis equestris]